MAYRGEISRKNLGLFLLLLDQSGSMAEPFAGRARGKIKAEGVTDAVNRLMANLVLKCTKSEGVRRYFEVGAIGYGSGEGVVESAFKGNLYGRDLVGIDEIASNPLRIEEREKKVEDGAGGVVTVKEKFPVWFEPVAIGDTPMCAALSKAYEMVEKWIKNHPSSFPPVIINISDGEATDDSPFSYAKKLMSLATQDGNALLFNCHISSNPSPSTLFPGDGSSLPDEFARMLFEMSSVLPEPILEEAKKEGFSINESSRGFAFNADLADLIMFLDIGTRGAIGQLR